MGATPSRRKRKGGKPKPPQPRETYVVDPHYNIIIVGEAGIGKSSLLMRWLDGSYTGEDLLVSWDSQSKPIPLCGYEQFGVLEVYDTNGQERFRVIDSCWHRNQDGVIIAFDINDEESWKDIRRWEVECSHYCQSDTQYLLLGLKFDLERRVSLTDIHAHMKNNGYIQYISYLEVSTKDNKNVALPFERLLVSMFKIRCSSKDVDMFPGLFWDIVNLRKIFYISQIHKLPEIARLILQLYVSIIPNLELLIESFDFKTQKFRS